MNFARFAERRPSRSKDGALPLAVRRSERSASSETRYAICLERFRPQGHEPAVQPVSFPSVRCVRRGALRLRLRPDYFRISFSQRSSDVRSSSWYLKVSSQPQPWPPDG